LVRILVFPGAGLKKPAVGKHLHKERCRIVRATLNSFPRSAPWYFFLVRTLFDLIILFLSVPLARATVVTLAG
jgi:hypothetical protein